MNAHLRPAAAPLRRSLRVLTFPTIRRKHPWVFRWLFAAPRVLAGWAVFSAILIPYSLLRAVGDDTALPHDQTVMLHLDRAIGLGVTPTQRLQGWLYAGSYSWLDWFCLGAYISFFFAPLVLMTWFLIAKPRLFPGMMLMMGVLYYAAALSFLLLPTEPPWMSLHLTRIVTQWHTSPIDADSNPLAAFPSLHVGTMVALALWLRSVRERWLAAVFAVLSALVAFTVVYFGEHYVVDVVAGGLFAASAVIASRWIEVHAGSRVIAAARHALRRIRWRRRAAEPVSDARTGAAS